MARSGGFGGSGLNPLGGGSLGNLSQYDIGADLADLATYETEVAWGNGLATDADYIAALKHSVDATDPNTQRRDTAQNKLDDAVYRIDRSKAAAKGLDDVIAFDQGAIAKMNPDNLRYRDVKESLDSELAQRRSRDYGKLVTDYNAGKGSTESLLGWVTNTLKTISPTDPDFDNWTSTKADLTDRITTEKDSKVYQDFQQGRMKAPEFLAYLTTRRNGYDPASPQYADWSRRLEDATKQVDDQKQAAADTAFFNSYEEGHKSDASYMAYLRNRISKMKADDPDRPSWQHRLNQAAFSLAEDKLRFDVQEGKQSVSKLVSFYRSYRSTLNPGSAEWRTVTRALDSLHGGGGGGGGGGSRRSSGGSSKKPGTATGGILGGGKAINPTTVDGALSLMTVNPLASKKDQKTAREFFDLNYTSLENARQRGDRTFTFFDPRTPGKTTELPVSDDMFGQMSVLKATYQYQLASLALQGHDQAGFADHMRQALNAQDKARVVGSQSVQKAADVFYQQAQDGIDAALRVGDYTTAMNLAVSVSKYLAQEQTNPSLDETRRAKLDALGEKLASNPFFPKADPTRPGVQIGGAVDLTGSTRDADGNFTSISLNPGWHHVLDRNDDSGGAKWGLEYDAKQDGSWEATHRTVTTGYGNQAVTGEVKVSSAPTNPYVFVTTPDGVIRVDSSAAQYMTFTDEHGQLVRAYSLDGTTWIRPLSGGAPQVEVNANLTKAADGSGLVDQQGKLVFKSNEPGNKDAGYTFVGDPSQLGWYGQSDRLNRSFRDPSDIATGPAASRPGTFLTGKQKDDITAGPGLGFRTRGSLGAPGQQMQLTTAGSDGAITFLSDHQQDVLEHRLLGTRGGQTTRTASGSYSDKPVPLLPGDSRSESSRPLATTSYGLGPEGVLSPGVGIRSAVPPPAHLAALPPPTFAGKKGTAPPPTMHPTIMSAGKLKDDLALPTKITPPKLKPKRPPARPAARPASSLAGKQKDDLALPRKAPAPPPPAPRPRRPPDRAGSAF